MLRYGCSDWHMGITRFITLLIKLLVMAHAIIVWSEMELAGAVCLVLVECLGDQRPCNDASELKLLNNYLFK